MHPKFPTLFSPLQIKGLFFKNRMISAPMGSHVLTADGYFSNDAIDEYELLAKGGVAAVTIGETLVHSATGNNHGRVLRLDDEGSLHGLHQCTDAIHRHGALASIELMHPGQRADPKYNARQKTYGPSGGMCHYGEGEHEVTELTEEMIDVIVNAFGDAAEKAMLTGCDYVTVHAGHGWLLNQFLSPINNKRTDRFGGSIENRARFSLMVADNIRRKCGKDFVIDFRISGDDFMEGGATQQEIIVFAKMLAQKIDMLHVSAASFHNRRASIRMFPSMFYPRGVNAFLAEEIRKHISIPVVTVGGFADPAHMEELLAAKRVDMIALARELLADPFLPEKARSGREDDIVYCTRCNNCMSVGFVPYVKYNVGVSHCSVNPWFGLAPQYLRRQVPQGGLKVMVVGGGPAGMQAALGASDAGHETVLFEKSSRLGGMLRHAYAPDFKKDIQRYIEVLNRRIEARNNIEVFLNQTASPETARAFAPDVLIVGLGARPIVLDLPGMDDPRVVQAIHMHNGAAEIGQKVVVIGGGQVGVEEAIHLAKPGRDVTVVEQAGKMAGDAAYIHFLAMTAEMENIPNLLLRLHTRCTGVDARGVVCVDALGNEVVYPADTIVVAVGLAPLREEAMSFLNCAPQVTLVGDCRRSSQMSEAILSGYFAGYHARRL
jgi:2,4-dienoyl-CoA reductase-like NADH-dependent reductase (Old Yellow Enzyme family)/thioredoxin reductase